MLRHIRVTVWLGWLGLLIVAGFPDGHPVRAGDSKPRSRDVVDYNRDVRPILAKNCFACHGQDDSHRAAGLRLDQRDSALKELKTGNFAIVPGKPEESELFRRITTDVPEERMPPEETGNQLTPEQIAILKRWIEQGARYAPHWAFVKPIQPPIPSVQDASWPRNPIDNFVLAELEALGRKPSPEADPYTLLRRLSLDLRGLPPTPEEVQEFVHDPSPDAYEKMVDRFLADPAYGERWARVWLDLARYADSAGYGSDPLRTIWRYRDWVIDAFNRNLPYDQFTIEQLAGDLLPNPTLDQKIATAFHRNTMTNTEGGTDDEEFRVAAVKDRVDTTFQVWMGLTMGCAKCHSHKYDPISITEYYRVFAIFNQTADNDQPSEAPVLAAPTPDIIRQTERIEAKIAELRKELEKPRSDVAEAQTAWEARLRADADWAILKPEEVRSEGGASFVTLEDGSLRAEGVNPERDTYVVTAVTSVSGVTAFRLEVLPDPSLPNKGVGRSTHGNFVLGRFTVTAEPANRPSSRPVARFVRIELPGKGRILSLAEVQVLSERDNVALKGEASQSSTAFDGPARLALDGNTDGNYANGSVTHTNVEDNPWWEVRLPQATPIDEIILWNRTDGALGNRLANFTISLLDDSRKVVWQETRSDFPNPSMKLSPSGRRNVKLARAFADYSQYGFPVMDALTGKGKGWAVGPLVASPHFAVFVAESPLPDGPQRLTFRLEHRYNEPGFNIGRFRLSVTNDARVVERAALPQDVLAILDTPPDKRTGDQSAKLAAYFRSITPLLQSLRDEIARLEQSRPKPPTVPVMQELPPNQRRTTHVLVKGNHLVKGEAVEPGVPAAFHPLPASLPRQSETTAASSGGGTAQPVSRLTLAYWLMDENNPLTARVAVNRWWSQIWGNGLMPSEEDWGTQGEVPTHPELLDWLAVEYRRSGWDTKALLKLIVTSATYRQTSRATPEALAADPHNRLLGRGPRFRLEAEMVRDQALALSGMLSRKIGGPSVFPPQPPGLWQAAFNGERTWPTSTGPDRYRRGIYTFWRRTVPYPSMATFDATSRETCTIRRVRTNTPLQAFVTLNDPVYVELAQALARRIVREGGSSTEERAAYGLRLCLGRPPRPEQVREIVALVHAERDHYRHRPDEARKLASDPLGPLPPDADPVELAAWTVAANVLMNLDGVLTKN